MIGFVIVSADASPTKLRPHCIRIRKGSLRGRRNRYGKMHAYDFERLLTADEEKMDSPTIGRGLTYRVLCHD